MEIIESGNSECIKHDHIKGYRSGGALIFLSAFLSLFIPSSLGGVIIPNLSVIAIVSSSALLMFHFVRSPLNICNFILFLIFICLLLLFTILSKNGEFTPGAIFPYLGMWMVLVTFPPDYVSAFSRKIFHLMAIILIVFGFGVVLGGEDVRGIIFDFYQAYNDELYYFMVEVGDKPVGPFATHSLSAFMYCLFSVVYFRLYLHSRGFKSFLFLVMCLSFFLMVVALKSFSAIALSVILVCLYMYYLVASFKVLKIFLIVIISVAVVTLVDATFFYESVDAILSSDGNGLKGRMVSGNRLEGTYNYITENPFLPLGLTSLPNIAFGDNFIADYVIRVGVLGYFVVLLAAYLYLRSAFSSRLVVLFCMGFVLLGDLGYPLLTNYRSVFLIPVFVAMWRCPVGGGGSPYQISTR
ncbi:hypothetical protein QQ999_15885 [Pseudomonas fluorescens]